LHGKVACRKGNKKERKENMTEIFFERTVEICEACRAVVDQFAASDRRTEVTFEVVCPLVKEIVPQDAYKDEEALADCIHRFLNCLKPDLYPSAHDGTGRKF
jgi:hypothetical protein